MRLTPTGILRGREALLTFLSNLLAPAVLRAESLTGSEDLAAEMRRLVPRDTGELESEIRIIPWFHGPGVSSMRVGVPASSPAIDKAWATEFGAWNYGVGRPEAPKTRWPSKSKAGAVMPWNRTAVLRRRNGIIRGWRQRLARRFKR